MRIPRVLSCGMMTIDDIIALDVFPKEGTTNRMDHHTVSLGGPAGRAALVCSELRAETLFVGMIGSGYYAKRLREIVSDLKLSTRFFVSLGTLTSQHSINLISRSTNSRTTMWAPQPKATQACITYVLSAMERYNVLLADCTDMEMTKKALMESRKNRVTSIIDTGSYKDGIEDVVRLGDVVIGPETFFTGLYKDSSENYCVQLEGFYKAFRLKCAVMTRGGKGGLYISSDNPICQAYNAENVKVVDSCGAGDAFHGAFAFGAALGWSVERTIRFSSWVAAKKCQGFGNETIPNYEEALSRIKVGH